MKRNAKTAFRALEKMGAPVYDREEHGAEFILGGELRHSGDTYFADYWQEQLKEHLDANGKIQNPFGIRTDVADLLKKHGLYAEWINGGMAGIYQA